MPHVLLTAWYTGRISSDLGPLKRWAQDANGGEMDAKSQSTLLSRLSETPGNPFRFPGDVDHLLQQACRKLERAVHNLFVRQNITVCTKAGSKPLQRFATSAAQQWNFPTLHSHTVCPRCCR